MALPNEPPYADAGRDMTVAVAEVAYFQGEGIDEDGRIDLYKWDFDGDGTYETSSATSGYETWTYQAIGIYYAVLMVIDNDGANDTDKVKVTVVEGNEPPSADAGDDLKVHAQELVYFHGTGSDPDGDIIEYQWDFDGDGKFDYSSDETGETTWIYTIPDTYYAVFKVTDDGAVPGNDSATIKVVVYSENRPPVADAGVDMVVYAEETVRFSGSGKDIDGRIKKFEWDFDDNGKVDFESSSTGEATWKYKKQGEYTAVLTVTDNHELPSTDQDSITVTVLGPNKPPKADAGAQVTAKANEPVQFDGKGTDTDNDVVEWRWDFDGDGEIDWSSSHDGKTTYIYTSPGTYHAKLQVLDEVGAIAEDNRTVVITEDKKPDNSEPLIAFNLSFIIALIIGICAGIGAGVGAAYGYLRASIASKYRKVQQLESRGPPDEEASFRSGPGLNGPEREPPAFR
jgi:PKD repeat protein